MKLYELKLTIPEVRHLIALIENNERDGSYYAPEKQYRDRSDRIKLGLELILCASNNWNPTRAKTL